MENPAQFLHKNNPRLHTSKEVEGVVDYLRDNGEGVSCRPAHKIESYLGFLADTDCVNDGILTGGQESIDRQVEAHIIRAEDVPESYFDLQRRAAREQGHGDIAVTAQRRAQLIEIVRADQRSSLATWAEYLGQSDYPGWFRYYAWNSVTKLSKCVQRNVDDKQKTEFRKRDKTTVAPYPELNREALATIYDAIKKKLDEDPNRKNKNQVEDGQLRKLVNNAGFGLLYGYALDQLRSVSPEQKELVRGSWVRYEQSDDPDRARELAVSLQGYGTEWCTAGEATAAKQLQAGDFHVYYTANGDGENTVPRVAIRMRNGSVEEVRGINPHQELEPVMVDIALNRLNDLPGGKEYTQKAEDMNRLTALEARLVENPHAELDVDDIVFLYEVRRFIEGFGYGGRDPRVKRLVDGRDVLHDMAKICGGDPEDSKATLLAMIALAPQKEYPHLPYDRVLKHCVGLGSDVAQKLISVYGPRGLADNFGSFSDLSDELAQKLYPILNPWELDVFSGLSEDTFLKMLDSYSTIDSRNYSGSKYVPALIEKAGRFNLSNPQKIVDYFMEQRRYGDVVRIVRHVPGVNHNSVVDSLIECGQTLTIIENLANFPTLDHQEFADRLLQKSPTILALYLDRLDIDFPTYAAQLELMGQGQLLSAGLRQKYAGAKPPVTQESILGNEPSYRRSDHLFINDKPRLGLGLYDVVPKRFSKTELLGGLVLSNHRSTIKKDDSLEKYQID